MPIIDDVSAIQILDSRGNPTLKVYLTTVSGAVGVACVPSGASTGEFEAYEKRDNGEQYNGKGVLKAIKSIATEIFDLLVGKFSVTEQREIDNALIKLDGTDNKSRLGANAILGVSLAVAKAAADFYEMPLYKYIGGMSSHLLPTPMMNILNGGAHAQNGLDFQEFMIMPVGAEGFSCALRMGSEIFHSLKKVLTENRLSTAVGDEGGFAPDICEVEKALDLIKTAVEKAGYKLGDDILLAIDVASSEFYDKNDGLYHLKGEGKTLSAEELIDYYKALCEKYPIVSIEDPFEQNDFENTAKLTKALDGKVQIVGDDLFVTNSKRLKYGIEKKAGNSILIKPNQIGTLSETIDAIVTAKRANYSAVISHRSGETEDTTISDIAVAMNVGQIKTGSLSRSERIAKYNRLLEIECSLGENSKYAGISAFNNLLH